MYEEMPGFSAGTASLLSEDCFSQMATSAARETHNPSFPENVGLSMENLAFASQDAIANTATSPLIEANPHGNNIVNTHLVEEVNHPDSNQLAASFDQSKWDTNMNYHHQNHHQHQEQPLPYSTADPRNLLYSLPSTASTCSFANSSISFQNPTTQQTVEIQNPSGHGGLTGGPGPILGAESTNVSSVLLQDPFLHLNLPVHPPALKEWFQSLPSRNDFLLLGGEDDQEGSAVVSYLDADHGRDFDNNGILKFTQDLAPVGRKGGRRGGKRIKQVTTEKKRRVDFSSKFDALRELIPNPTKNDRASLLWAATEYIQELRKSVSDLTLLVNKKRCGKERIKRHKVEEEEALGDLESCNLKPLTEPDHHLHPCNRCIIRSSWLQKKSEDTEVDVRIIDDEVTIKLVQRKNTNCLLYASKALDELELDLQHVAGGHIGDFCSFLFNSKIYEGSSVCASAIANKLIEVMDRSFQAA